MEPPLHFLSETVAAKCIAPNGQEMENIIEIRTNPITQRTSRVTLSRKGEKERGAEMLPTPPPDAQDRSNCPFCRPQVLTLTPQLRRKICPDGRLVCGQSLLFPNLFPYSAYSAVSLFDDNHFVEIGTASLSSYRDSLLNCAAYLKKIREVDDKAVFMAISQNHLPSAGGSLLHPHLQVNADKIPANHQRFLLRRAKAYHWQYGSSLYSDYLKHERDDGRRYIGNTGDWHWLTAFAPEGFYEIWSILPGRTSLLDVAAKDWQDLAEGIINTQKLYRSLCRNGYNFGLTLIEDGNGCLELRATLIVRSNFAPWVRNDHTGFELMLGDMATFTAPEETAQLAKNFWSAG